MTRRSLPKAGVRDTVGVVMGVVGPTVGKGVIIRRPRMVGVGEKLSLDDRAVQRMQRLRSRYGPGPLMLRLPLRKQALILSPEHVHRVLRETPEPFATAESAKRAALSHFQPEGALISHGPERQERRRYNEQVLGHDSPIHRMAERFTGVVEEEASRMLGMAGPSLDWDRFNETWMRVVRRVVFGDAAVEDHEITNIMASLRGDANWVLKPKRGDLQRRLFEKISHYIARGEPGSLAGMMAGMKAGPRVPVEQQVPQWLFAFDPAGMTSYRALALLSRHPAQAARARNEVQAAGSLQELPFLRACMQETLRLWPTTPAVLRETTREVEWETGVMPKGTAILIFAPFFHRDDQRLSFAHRFTPELWLQERTGEEWPLLPFSGGPGICPGRHLVQMLGGAMIASVLMRHDLRMHQPERLDPARIPGILNQYSVRLELRPLQRRGQAEEQPQVRRAG
jgi:cytochrome P450